MTNGFRIVVFISGRGSNLSKIIEGASGSYEIAGVISNRANAAGLAIAQQAAIPCYTFPRKSFTDPAHQKQAIYDQASALDPDLIVLAGYMQILEPHFVRAHLGRIINIHPSLLPSFPGLSPHAQAISAGATEHGCTVHYVTEEIDAGPVVAQASLSVSAAETAEQLASRVLELEHRLYPWCLRQIAIGHISCSASGSITLSQETLASASQLGFLVQPDLVKRECP